MGNGNGGKTLRGLLIGGVGTVVFTLMIWLLSFPYNNIIHRLDNLQSQMTALKAQKVTQDVEMAAVIASLETMVNDHQRRIERLEE